MLVKQPHLHVRANRTTQCLLFLLPSWDWPSCPWKSRLHSIPSPRELLRPALTHLSPSLPWTWAISVSCEARVRTQVSEIFFCSSVPRPFNSDWPEEPRKGKFPFSPTGLSTYLLEYISPLLKSAWNYRFRTLSWKKSGFIMRARCWWHDPMIILPLKGKKTWASGGGVCVCVCVLDREKGEGGRNREKVLIYRKLRDFQ